MIKSEEIKKLLEKEKLDQVLEILIDNFTKSKDDKVREDIVNDLIQIGIKYPSTASLLIGLAKKQHEDEYQTLINTLYNIINKTPENFINIVPTLIQELSNQNVYTVIKQILNLIRIKAPKEFIKILIEKFKNIDDPFRWRYILELGEVGVKVPEENITIIPYLTGKLNDENEQVRAAATDSLARIRTQAPIKLEVDPITHIKAQTNDESEIVREVAKDAISTIKKVKDAEKIVANINNKEKDTKEK